MGTIGNQPVPGAYEMNREIQEAVANSKQITVKTTVATHKAAARDVHFSNGTITINLGGNRIVIPFHAIAELEIH